MFHNFDWAKAVGAPTAFALAAFLILLAFGKLDRPLDRLINAFVQVTDALGHALVRWLRTLCPADTHDVEPDEDEPGDGDRLLNPATRPVGLTLDEVLEVARRGNAEDDPAVALEERMRQLSADMAQRYGSKLTVGVVRSDYDPRADYQDPEPDETDGSEAVPDGDRVEPFEEDRPRAIAAAPEPLPAFSRWDVNEVQAHALTYNAMGAVPEAPSGALAALAALEAPTGSWKLYDRNAVSA